MRSLQRVVHLEPTTFTPELGLEDVATWFNQILDAEYELTMLSAACSSRHRESIQKAAHKLFEDVQFFARSHQDPPLEAVSMAYQVVVEAARDDVGSKG